MLRLCSLGSGSTGNATVVEAGDGSTTTRLLVDCGLSLKDLDARLASRSLQAGDLDGVFVTHEHGDHIGSAVALARREGLPLFMSEGTGRACDLSLCQDDLDVRWVRDGAPFVLRDLEVQPFTVPHDAAEPLQLACSDGASRIGILTDLGTGTPHVLQQLQSCNVLLLECNHDPELLQSSRYPAFLKARVGGRLGHLSNAASATLLAGLQHPGLRHVMAAHLSEQNNRPDLAQSALAQVLGSRPDEVLVASPRVAGPWLQA